MGGRASSRSSFSPINNERIINSDTTSFDELVAKNKSSTTVYSFSDISHIYISGSNTYPVKVISYSKSGKTSNVEVLKPFKKGNKFYKIGDIITVKTDSVKPQ